ARLRALSLSPSGAPDRKDNPKAVRECDQVADKAAVGEQRYPEQGRPSRYRHHDGRTDHERCGHDTDRGAIHRSVDAITEAVEALEIELNAHAAVTRVLDQAGKVTRHRGDQPQEVAERRLAPPQRLDGLITLRHGTPEKRLHAVDQTKLRIVLAAKTFK